MGVFDGYAKRMLRPGKGDHDPVPQKGSKRVFYIFVTHFWKIVTLNLVFVLFSIPVVTIPAAICGMVKVLYTLYTEGTVDVYKDFIAEFRISFKKSIIPGLIGLVGLGGGGFALDFYLQVGGTFGTIGLVFTAAIMIWVWVFLNHLFYQIAVVDLPLGTLMKNARILSVGKVKQNFLLILVSGVILFLMVFFLPLSVIPSLFIVLAFCQLCSCAILFDSVMLCIK